MARAGAIFGGLLSGVGEGIVTRAQERRAIAMELAKEYARQRERQEDRAFDLQRDDLRHERNLARDEATFERNRGLLSRTITDQDGGVHGMTRGGETFDTGLKTTLPGSGKSGSGGGGGDVDSGLSMSAEEKRIYDEVKSRYTDPNMNRVEWPQFIEHLRNMPEERGGGRWNEIADYLTGAIGTNMTEAEAREQAESDARERGSGLFTRRKTAFAETGGDRDAWVEQRTRELVGGGKAAQEKPAEKAPDKAPASVAGGGTQDNPYRPTTQAEFDQLPAGAVFVNPSDGKLYRKN